MLEYKASWHVVGDPLAVEQFVLNYQGRPINRSEQRIVHLPWVITRMQRQHPCARDPQKMFFQTLAVCRAIPTLATHRRAHNQWHTHLFVVHIAKLGSMIQPLIKRQRQKVPKHDFGHWQPALQGETTAHAY